MRVSPSIEVVACPMADGGEGTLDAVLAAIGSGGRRHRMSVRGAGGSAIEAAYGLLDAPDGPTAVLEAAQVVGITDAAGMATPVGARTTRGLGELIRALLDQGVRRYMIGVGGSSTNDGGAGMLLELGLALVAADGRANSAGSRGSFHAGWRGGERARSAVGVVRDHDHVRRQQSAHRRARRHRDLRPAERRAAGATIALRRGHRAFRRTRGGRDRATRHGRTGRGRGGRARLRAANDRRHVCIRRATSSPA